MRTGKPWPTSSTSWMIWQSLYVDPESDAVRAPSRAADEIALYAYSKRLMSMAVNMTRKKMGETSANSTSAWLRCPRTYSFNETQKRCANELNNALAP